MKVGDLVRHQMYDELKSPSLVLAVDKWIDSIFIRLLDPDDGIATWHTARDYEAISESR